MLWPWITWVMTMTDRITEAARAMRKYWPAPHWEFPGAYSAAQAACDRLNLLAVLEALREPSVAMQNAAWHRPVNYKVPMYADIWRAMIDELAAEVKGAD